MLYTLGTSNGIDSNQSINFRLLIKYKPRVAVCQLLYTHTYTGLHIAAQQVHTL